MACTGPDKPSSIGKSLESSAFAAAPFTFAVHEVLAITVADGVPLFLVARLSNVDVGEAMTDALDCRLE